MKKNRGAEPSLDELLGDDATRLLMASDGVEERYVRALLGTIREARRAPPQEMQGSD